jgi:uncharacterized membrane protein YfcA
MAPGVQLARTALIALLALLGAVFVVLAGRAVRREARAGNAARPTARHLVVGAMTDFFDTLGIGSFATTTTAFRLGRLVDDRVLPGTMNVGHALPTVVQAVIYISIIRIDMTTLMVMIGASIVGSVLGAGVVSAWPRRTVRFGVGAALVVAAALMLASSIGALPKGGDALALAGPLLWIGAFGNLVLGALMTAGVGLYGPCMILVSVLGMSPAAAFPIMMGSCAFLMLAASTRFVERRAYDPRAALGLALGGVPGVLLAAFVVRSLPLAMLRWLVVVVAAYTAVTLVVAAVRDDP